MTHLETKAGPARITKRGFKFELKAVTDEGTFEGLLSVYNAVDLGGDSVEPGAFSKSIAERGAEVPMLWQHDSKQPIGVLTLEDTPEALKVKGQLVLEVERAREALALMKAGALKGLSIGYDTVKSVMDDGVRRLKEIRLWEGSLVTFPMLPLAQVDIASVKAAGEKATFVEVLSDIQTWSLRYQMQRALEESLDSILWNGNLSPEEKTAQVAQSIDQFREQYIDFLPSWFSLMDGTKALDDLIERKGGRRISAATRSQIEEAIGKLSALLEDSAGDATEEEKGAAPHGSQEPELVHSWLEDLSKELKGHLANAN